jgi:hypothetical protein
MESSLDLHLALRPVRNGIFASLRMISHWGRRESWGTAQGALTIHEYVGSSPTAEKSHYRTSGSNHEWVFTVALLPDISCVLEKFHVRFAEDDIDRIRFASVWQDLSCKDDFAVCMRFAFRLLDNAKQGALDGVMALGAVRKSQLFGDRSHAS